MWLVFNCEWLYKVVIYTAHRSVCVYMCVCVCARARARHITSRRFFFGGGGGGDVPRPCLMASRDRHIWRTQWPRLMTSKDRHIFDVHRPRLMASRDRHIFDVHRAHLMASRDRQISDIHRPRLMASRDGQIFYVPRPRLMTSNRSLTYTDHALWPQDWRTNLRSAQTTPYDPKRWTNLWLRLMTSRRRLFLTSTDHALRPQDSFNVKTSLLLNSRQAVP